ncbi:MAG TPA: RNA-binding cell elongation regulator Jag/EloR [Tissierellaceae bacterium]
MNYVIKISKTVEDALKEALEELNVTEDEVEVEVLEQPNRGFLGLIGAKDATIKVTVVDNVESVAYEFIEEVINSIGVEGDISVSKDGNLLYVSVDNIDPKRKGILIGKRGSTLDAVQYLLSLAVNKDRQDYLKVLVDVGGYRDKRKETLERLALRMGEKAVYQKKPVKLEPMNAYERKIIHSALQGNTDVTTYSEGNEPYRRVVIKAK